MYLEGLDETDRKIINLLTENARMSYVDIAKEVNLSRVAVKARVSALEESGIIEKYTIIVNPQKINSSISFYLEAEVKPEYFNEVIEVLNKNDVVTKIYQITGRSKLHIHAVASGQSEMQDFLENVMYKLPGLLNLNCDVIVSRIKDIIGLKL